MITCNDCNDDHYIRDPKTKRLYFCNTCYDRYDSPLRRWARVLDAHAWAYEAWNEGDLTDEGGMELVSALRSLLDFLEEANG